MNPQMQPATAPYGQAPLSAAPMPQQTPGGMFERRMGRADFLLGGIYLSLLFIIPVLIEAAINFLQAQGSATGPTALSTVGNLLSIVGGMLGVILVIPLSISLDVRRLHDLNKSGWWILLGFVPFAGLLLAIYTLFVPGTPGPNTYGAPVYSHNFWVVLGFKRPV